DGLLSDAWETGLGKIANQSVRLAFLSGNTYRISGVVIDPSAPPGTPASEDLKGFQIRVSTGGTAEGDFTTVFSGQCKQQAGLQRFVFPVPVRATAVELVTLSNYGSTQHTAVAEMEAVATASLFAQPNGIALDSKGFSYVVDINSDRILKVSPKGKIVA